MLETFRIAVEEGATTINVPDTVGYATPDEFGDLVRLTREAMPEIDQSIGKKTSRKVARGPRR